MDSALSPNRVNLFPKKDTRSEIQLSTSSSKHVKSDYTEVPLFPNSSHEFNSEVKKIEPREIDDDDSIDSMYVFPFAVDSTKKVLSSESYDYSYEKGCNEERFEDGCETSDLCEKMTSSETEFHQSNIPTMEESLLSTDTNPIEQSMNFSTLMHQAEDNNKSFHLDNLRESIFEEEDPDGRIISRPNPFHLPSPQEDIQSSIFLHRWPIIEERSSDSFKLSCSIQNTTIRDTMDVVSNPDLLRDWLESFDSLIVTDHKGGSSSLQSLNSSNGRKYAEGEWIEASTSQIILPPSHTNFVEGWMRKTKQILGFGQYGSVLMFIERNHNKVTLTVGPYKNGHCLEHKIQIHPQQHNDCVILTDEVIVKQNDALDHSTLVTKTCSCLEVIQEWFQCSLDGYLMQTQKSLINLILLIEKGEQHYNAEGQMILPPVDTNGLEVPLLG